MKLLMDLFLRNGYSVVSKSDKVLWVELDNTRVVVEHGYNIAIYKNGHISQKFCHNYTSTMRYLVAELGLSEGARHADERHRDIAIQVIEERLSTIAKGIEVLDLSNSAHVVAKHIFDNDTNLLIAIKKEILERYK